MYTLVSVKELAMPARYARLTRGQLRGPLAYKDNVLRYRRTAIFKRMQQCYFQTKSERATFLHIRNH